MCRAAAANSSTARVDLALPRTTGRHCEQVPRRVSGRQVGDVLWSYGGGQLRKPQLALESRPQQNCGPYRQECSAMTPRVPAAPVASCTPRAATSVESRNALTPAVYASSMSRASGLQTVVVSFRGPFEPPTPHKPVGLETAWPRILRPPPQASHPVVVHLEQPVLSSREPLCKKQVEQIPCLDMRDAPGISIYIDRTAQAVEGHSGPHVRQGSGEVFVVNCVGHLFEAPMVVRIADVTLPTSPYRIHKTTRFGHGSVPPTSARVRLSSPDAATTASLCLQSRGSSHTGVCRVPSRTEEPVHEL